jgi:hypothetical protein
MAQPIVIKALITIANSKLQTRYDSEVNSACNCRWLDPSLWVDLALVAETSSCTVIVPNRTS